MAGHQPRQELLRGALQQRQGQPAAGGGVEHAMPWVARGMGGRGMGGNVCMARAEGGDVGGVRGVLARGPSAVVGRASKDSATGAGRQLKRVLPSLLCWG